MIEGSSCPHPDRKKQARGMCGACYIRFLKEVNPAFHERYKKYQRERSRNPEYKEGQKVVARARRARNLTDPAHKKHRRELLLKRKYGISAAEYDTLLASQGGGCALCSRKPGDIPLHVDHCHETGLVRGILCHQCNWYVGKLEANAKLLPNLIYYMEKANDILHKAIKP